MRIDPDHNVYHVYPVYGSEHDVDSPLDVCPNGDRQHRCNCAPRVEPVAVNFIYTLPDGAKWREDNNVPFGYVVVHREDN